VVTASLRRINCSAVLPGVGPSAGGEDVRRPMMLGGIAALAVLAASIAWGLAARRELGELRAAAKVAAISASASTPPSPDAPSSAGAPGSPSPTHEEVRAQILEAHGREPVDAQWRTEAEARLDDLLRRSLPSGSRRVSLACRTRSCKVEVSHRDPAAALGEGLNAWVFALTGPGAWSGAAFIADKREESGQVVQTLVLFRDGDVSGATAR
jgi:hypothetical protein